MKMNWMSLNMFSHTPLSFCHLNWWNFLFLMLFCHNSAKKSRLSKMQRIYDGRTEAHALTYREFPSNWLLKDQLYSEMKQLRNITKIDLCTVFTLNHLNILFWLQFHHEFLPVIRKQKFALFARNVISYIWLEFYFVTV